MALKIKRPSYGKTEAENDQVQLRTILEQKKLLEEREKEIKARLGLYMEKHLPADRKGHFIQSVTNGEGVVLNLMRQARKKINLNQEKAIAYLTKHGLTSAIRSERKIADEVTTDQLLTLAEEHADWMLETITVADEADVAQLITNKKISMDDFEQLCDIEVNYSMVYLTDKQMEDYNREKESDQHATSGGGEAVQAPKSGNRKTVSNRKASD